MFTMPYTVWTLRTFIANVLASWTRRHSSMMQSLADVLQDHPALVAPGLIATSVYGWILA